MAVITTRTWIINGVPFTQRVTCGRDGIFKAKTPSAWCEAIGITEVFGKTLNEFNRNWSDADKRYKTASTETRKVIVYKVEATPEMFFSQGIGVVVFARVYMEEKTRTSSGGNYYYYREVESQDDLPWELRTSKFSIDIGRCANDKDNEYRFLDWTPERHAFFARIADAMTALVDKLKTLENAKTIDALATSQFRLLPDAAEEKGKSDE